MRNRQNQRWNEEKREVDRIRKWVETPKINIPQTERMKMLEHLCDEIQQMLAEEYIEAVIKIKPCPLGTGDAILEIETDELIVRDIPRFCMALQNLRNFEIYVSEDGKLHFAGVIEKLAKVIPLNEVRDVE